MFLKSPAHHYAYSHNEQVYKPYGDKIAPLKHKYLVDAQAREGPAYPHKHPYNKEGLSKKEKAYNPFKK